MRISFEKHDLKANQILALYAQKQYIEGEI